MSLTPTEKVLITLLAKRDALFVTHRRFALQDNSNPNVSLGRRDYRLEGGTLWTASGKTSSERGKIFRSFEDASARGLIQVTKLVRGHGNRALLSDAGEVQAQYIAMMPMLLEPEPWILFDCLKRRAGTKVPEDDLRPAWRASLQPTGEWTREMELQHIGDCLVPLIARGWVSSGSTLHGNARYWLSKTHSQARKPKVEMPAEFDDARADAGRALYVEVFDATYTGFSAEEPSVPGCIGMMPLSASATSPDEIAAWERSAALAAQGL